MNISDVRIRVLQDANKLKAIASITIDDCFVVHDLKVVDGANGLFVMMPSKKADDGSFKDVAHPLNTETRKLIQSSVLAAYTNAIAE